MHFRISDVKASFFARNPYLKETQHYVGGEEIGSMQMLLKRNRLFSWFFFSKRRLSIKMYSVYNKKNDVCDLRNKMKW